MELGQELFIKEIKEKLQHCTEEQIKTFNFLFNQNQKGLEFNLSLLSETRLINALQLINRTIINNKKQIIKDKENDEK